MEHQDIFSPKTLEKLNKKSAETLKDMLGNKTLMQTLISSQDILNQITEAEAPYKSQLEELAVKMMKKLYPVIDEEGIIIDAKLGSISDVNKSLDEALTPEGRRRIINGITQGAALKGAFAFYLFKEYLDKLDPSLIEMYSQIMKNSFGIYHDPNAVAMMLAQLAQGHKMAGGSSKVIIKEIKVNKPNVNSYVFKCNDGSSHMGTLLFNNQVVSTMGHLADLDSIVEINSKPKINIEDFYYFHGGYRLKKPFTIINQAPYPVLDLNESQDSGIIIKARAICFPMLIHEINKGLHELISLQGFKGDKAANQAVVNKVDTLANEPNDIKYGQIIYEALNDLFIDSKYSDDSRLREYFLQDVYQLEDDEFLSLVENSINEEVTPQQRKWVDNTLRDIKNDLKADDYDSTGLDENFNLRKYLSKNKLLQEIKINKPTTIDFKKWKLGYATDYILNIHPIDNYSPWIDGKVSGNKVTLWAEEDDLEGIKFLEKLGKQLNSKLKPGNYNTIELNVFEQDLQKLLNFKNND